MRKPLPAVLGSFVAGLAIFSLSVVSLCIAIPASATIQVVNPPDLRPTIDASSAVRTGTGVTFRIRVFNDGQAYAPSVPVRIYMNRGKDPFQWGTMLSATGGSCTQDGRRIDCTMYNNISGGQYQDLSLTIRILDVQARPDYSYHYHVDCGPRGTHHNGGIIRESNESNNLGVFTFAIYKRPDLAPVNFYTNDSYNGISRAKRGSTTIFMSQLKNYSAYGPTTTNIKVKATLPGMQLYSAVPVVTGFPDTNKGNAGFSCAVSNSSHTVTCTGGRMDHQDQLFLKIWGRPENGTPPIPIPMTITMDPDRRIAESNENNNTHTSTIQVY